MSARQRLSPGRAPPRIVPACGPWRPPPGQNPAQRRSRRSSRTVGRDREGRGRLKAYLHVSTDTPGGQPGAVGWFGLTDSERRSPPRSSRRATAQGVERPAASWCGPPAGLGSLSQQRHAPATLQGPALLSLDKAAVAVGRIQVRHDVQGTGGLVRGIAQAQNVTQLMGEVTRERAAVMQLPTRGPNVGEERDRIPFEPSATFARPRAIAHSLVMDQDPASRILYAYLEGRENRRRNCRIASRWRSPLQ